MGTFYVFECAVDNCDAEFYLNDIPVVLRKQDGGRLFGGPVNELVVEGINEIGVVINPGPEPGLALSGREGKRDRFVATDAKLFAALSIYPRGPWLAARTGKSLCVLNGPRTKTGGRRFFREWCPLKKILALYRVDGSGKMYRE